MPTSVERLRLYSRIITAVAVLALVGLVVLVQTADGGRTSVTGQLPSQVDRLIPDQGSSVLRQSEVGIDLAKGYNASIRIGDTTIESTATFDPATGKGSDGLARNLETGVLTYSPGPGRLVESLESGQNCLTANIWRSEDPGRIVSTVNWCFTAT